MELLSILLREFLWQSGQGEVDDNSRICELVDELERLSR